MSNLEDISRRVVAAYSILDFATVGSYFHDDFHIQALPASLGRPARAKAEYLEWIAGFKSTVKCLNLEILDLLVAENATTLHLRGRGEFVNGDSYRNEYMVIFKFKDDKIVAMKEFVDSAYVLSVMSKLRPKTETTE